MKSADSTLLYADALSRAGEEQRWAARSERMENYVEGCRLCVQTGLAGEGNMDTAAMDPYGQSLLDFFNGDSWGGGATRYCQMLWIGRS